MVLLSKSFTTRNQSQLLTPSSTSTHSIPILRSLKKLNPIFLPTKRCPMVPSNSFSSPPISALEATSRSTEEEALSPRGSDLILKCDQYDIFLVVSSVLFVLYLTVHAKKNLIRLCRGGSYVVVFYYVLLWLVTLLNLTWSFLQVHHIFPFCLLILLQC